MVKVVSCRSGIQVPGMIIVSSALFLRGVVFSIVICTYYQDLDLYGKVRL